MVNILENVVILLIGHRRIDYWVSISVRKRRISIDIEVEVAEVVDERAEAGLDIFVLYPLISSTRPQAAGEAITGDCEAEMRGRNSELLSGGENISGAGVCPQMLSLRLRPSCIFAPVSCLLSHTCCV